MHRRPERSRRCCERNEAGLFPMQSGSPFLGNPHLHRRRDGPPRPKNVLVVAEPMYSGVQEVLS
jgi:hypothetical protein